MQVQDVNDQSYLLWTDSYFTLELILDSSRYLHSAYCKLIQPLNISFEIDDLEGDWNPSFRALVQRDKPSPSPTFHKHTHTHSSCPPSRLGNLSYDRFGFGEDLSGLGQLSRSNQYQPASNGRHTDPSHQYLPFIGIWWSARLPVDSNQQFYDREAKCLL